MTVHVTQMISIKKIWTKRTWIFDDFGYFVKTEFEVVCTHIHVGIETVTIVIRK